MKKCSNKTNHEDIDDVIRPSHSRWMITVEWQKIKQKLDEKARSFGAAYSQWDTHLDPEWRQWWINEAKKYQDTMPEAKEFLQKVQNQR